MYLTLFCDRHPFQVSLKRDNERVKMIQECLNLTISLKILRDFSPAHGYTMTDLFYQQLVKLPIFHQVFSLLL